MESAVKEEQNGIIFHQLHPSFQKLQQLVKDKNKLQNKSNLLKDENDQKEEENNMYIITIIINWSVLKNMMIEK